MTPAENITQALKRSLDFSGRAARAEYWWFTLAWAVIAGAAVAFDMVVLNVDPVTNPQNGRAFPAALLLILVPHLSLSVRRLHDQDMRGWWWLITLLPWVGLLIHFAWMTRIGTQGDNRFGPDPMPAPVNPTRYF